MEQVPVLFDKLLIDRWETSVLRNWSMSKMSLDIFILPTDRKNGLI